MHGEQRELATVGADVDHGAYRESPERAPMLHARRHPVPQKRDPVVCDGEDRQQLRGLVHAFTAPADPGSSSATWLSRCVSARPLTASATETHAKR